MKTPINPWAYAPSTQRREPTSTEIANGFPCGPADQQLFNELMYRSSLSAREIATVITGEGIALDETKVNQLQQAIFKTIQRYNGSLGLYVNVSGNDANDGLTAATPLKTINEVIVRSLGYKQVAVVLGSDITITEAPVPINGTKISFNGPGVQRNITIAPGAWVTDPDGSKRTFRFIGAYDLNFDRINIINNVTESTMDAVAFGAGGFISFTNVSYYVASASVRPMFWGGNLTGITSNNLNFGNTDAAGRFLVNVPAGGDPNAYWPWKSNRTSM
ncbi:MAG TPA: hypothetical protein VGU72_01185 [Beijerinckiaceae bacterium]|jgi:hypothetical protein|nr:hypothetical protein [Beijerinckiaceae bacterium]